MTTLTDDCAARGIRFTVLGPLEIGNGAESVTLPTSKPVSLLAMLLLHPNRTVSATTLERALWGECPPESARMLLSTCVLRLRRTFTKYGVARDTIRTLPGGYRINVSADSLDLLRFRELAAAPAGNGAESELGNLRAAAALWQGTVLPNVDSELVQRTEVPRLREEWFRVMERIFEIEIALGRSAAVLAELTAVSYANPVHERLWELLVEALYRIGRRADALAQCRVVRATLREDIGIDVGPGLRRLELQILRDERLGPASPSREPNPSAARLVGHLVAVGLVDRGADGQYRMNEMLEAFARAAGSRS